VRATANRSVLPARPSQQAPASRLLLKTCEVEQRSTTSTAKAVSDWEELMPRLVGFSRFAALLEEQIGEKISRRILSGATKGWSYGGASGPASMSSRTVRLRATTSWSGAKIESQALATLAALAQISTPYAAHFIKSHQLLVQKFAADRDRQKSSFNRAGRQRREHVSWAARLQLCPCFPPRSGPTGVTVPPGGRVEV
jgi:hypothetical protein